MKGYRVSIYISPAEHEKYDNYYPALNTNVIKDHLITPAIKLFLDSLTEDDLKQCLTKVVKDNKLTIEQAKQVFKEWKNK